MKYLFVILGILIICSTAFAQLENYDITLEPNQKDYPKNHKRYKFDKYIPVKVRSGEIEEALSQTQILAIVDIESEIIIKQQTISNLNKEIAELEAMKSKILKLQIDPLPIE